MDHKINRPALTTDNYGFTLIELLIAMLIGSIIMVSAMSLFQSSLAQNLKVTYTAKLQEDSFFISHVLKQQLAQIGYRPIEPEKIVGRSIPVNNLKAAFPAVEGGWEAGQTISVTGTTLSYRYHGASDDTLAADSSIYDCLGNSVPNDVVQTNHISLQDNQIICSNDNDFATLLGKPQSVLVEQIVYRLGVDDNGDHTIDRYLDSADATSADFINTKLLTIRLLLANPNTVTRSKESYHFNQVKYESLDQKIRLESVITLALRN